MSREQAEKGLYKSIRTILLKDKEIAEQNVNLYKDMFSKMSDKDFEAFVTGMEKDEIHLQFIIPNGRIAVDVENNIKFCDEHNYPTLTKITIDDGSYISAPEHEAYVTLQPVRRLIQTADKKMAAAEHENSINVLTGQVTNASKAVATTLPETHVLRDLGLEKVIQELNGPRGGDTGAHNAMKKLIALGQPVDEEVIGRFSTGADSVNTLKSILLGAQLDNTLKTKR